MKAQITSASHVWRHEKTGLLRVRVDFFPDSGDPLYDGCCVNGKVNPINCHMFLLPIGFTQDDLGKAIRERMVGLKANMAMRATGGHSDISIDDMPKSLLQATYPLKGEGQALIPTLEKKWTPALVSQAGAVLNGLEVRE